MSSWLLSGNAGTVQGGDFLGTTDHQGLQFRTDGQPRTIILATGELLHFHNMGIGLQTEAPTVTLSVNSNTRNHDANNTAEFTAPQLGPNASHIHWGDNGDWFIRSADSQGKVILQDSGGNVGIGLKEPAFKLDVNGEVHAQDFLITSDARLKTNVTQLTGVLDSLALIHGVSFQWNKSSPLSDATSKKRQIGIMAQELKTIYPELVSSAGDHDYLAVDYSKLTVLLLEAIKELRAETTMIVKKLESELVAQKEELESLRNRIVD